MKFLLSKVLTRKILMRGGTPLRLTSAGSSILLGIHSLWSQCKAQSLLADALKKPAFSVAIPSLEKTQGIIVAITSLGAQLRVPGGSDGCIAKHAVNRLVEFIALGMMNVLISSPFSLSRF